MEDLDEKSQAVDAIRKKLVGKSLTYKEIFAVMDEIAHNRLGDILTTYFAASGYAKGFSNEELYFLTKAMIETGEKIVWHQKIVADKHSIGGVPGTRTTMIIIPTVAAAGFLIPKSSSRAITTPDGTADDMEVLSKVEFTKMEIEHIVRKTNGCIVWGGSFGIAPADDIMIHVESPLLFESYDKIIVSILAKKVAFGSNHVVIDLPYGPTVKVHRLQDAKVLEEKFLYVAKKFDIKMTILIHEIGEPAGRGIGPVLESQAALKVLEQTEDRAKDLEEEALNLAGALLDLCLKDSDNVLSEKIKNTFGNGKMWAKSLLEKGESLAKMREIITAQQGNPKVTAASLNSRLGQHVHKIIADGSGTVRAINNHHLTIIAKVLGAPQQKGSGIYLDKKTNERYEKGSTLFTMYSESEYNLKEALISLDQFPIMEM